MSDLPTLTGTIIFGPAKEGSMPNPDEKDIEDETAAVVERLREWVRHNGGRDSSGFSRSINVEEVAEAADLLERLSSEIERMRAERNEALAAARALRQFVSPPLTQADMDAAIEIARAIRPEIDAELSAGLANWIPDEKLEEARRRAMINAVPKPEGE